MSRLLIHISINIRKALVDVMQEQLDAFNRKHGMEITIEIPSHNHKENWLVKCLEQDSFPHMVLAHATDFAPLSREQLREIFLPVPNRFELRRELEDGGFVKDEDNILHPVGLVPFIIACNSKMIDAKQRPNNWEDLLNKSWYGRVTFPERDAPITQAVLSYLYDRHPQKLREFFPHIHFQKSVVEVVNAVGDGVFPLGIANIAFAKMLRQKNVLPLWPREGAVCIPQVMAWSRKGDERLLELGDFLLGAQIQNLYARQGFVPVNETVTFPAELQQLSSYFAWNGWEHFFNTLRKGSEIR